MKFIRCFVMLCLFLSLFSCSDNKIALGDIEVMYMRDEKASQYFVLYFSYPKGESFDANLEVRSEDGKYKWSASCQDFINQNEHYKVAGRFLIPDGTLDEKKLFVDVMYRDVKQSYEVVLNYPVNQYSNEDIEIFNLKANKQDGKWVSLFDGKLKRTENIKYSYKDDKGVSASMKISSVYQTLNVALNSEELHFVQQKNDYNGIYSKTIEI